MLLTKPDLSAIKKIVKDGVRGETGPLKLDLKRGLTKLDNKIDKLDNKFDKLFNFLDRDVSQVKRRVNYIDSHLGVNTSEF